MIELEGISKTYRIPVRSKGVGGAIKALFKREYEVVQALKGISFKINPGEIVGYIGPNGAGKSTTIKIMSGILVPDDGKCQIGGQVPWQDRKAYVGKIGVVFGQRSQLWWDVPVMDSFELLKEIYDMTNAQYERSFNELCDALELRSFLDHPVRQLSLGQRMRCEIAAALLHEPEILFLDEPTIGLDAVSKIAVRQFIRHINAKRGVTVILTTHDMSDIEALASRIMMIGKGEILYDGSLESLKRTYIKSKTITVDHHDYKGEVQIEGVTLISQGRERTILKVDTSERSIAHVVSDLTDQLSLKDVTIENEAIEDIVIRLYQDHQI
ncbi:ABC transporter ATP-binding protein [Fusibacter ferrireducens]|uniref:ATP-binding cassette domain-containing protein n=1 Tax=Fusibacter ferrireducens TaxID=2785058 RepID=A0ABR9ZUC7_9FIRM|nr:ATP-binding cassette domain-containing protein [Fusibacter ferrireducens]MBF4694076.1 ATP-binding cassette domain-containing protein [Fusibacter ferrireducens]